MTETATKLTPLSCMEASSSAFGIDAPKFEIIGDGACVTLKTPPGKPLELKKLNGVETPPNIKVFVALDNGQYVVHFCTDPTHLSFDAADIREHKKKHCDLVNDTMTRLRERGHVGAGIEDSVADLIGFLGPSSSGARFEVGGRSISRFHKASSDEVVKATLERDELDSFATRKLVKADEVTSITVTPRQVVVIYKKETEERDVRPI